MKLEAMPEKIQMAIKSILKEHGATRMQEGAVRVDAVIEKLDELSYWDQGLFYREKYDSIKKYLFTEDEISEPHQEMPPQLARAISEAVGDSIVIVDKLMPVGSYPDVEDDEHVN